MVTENGIEGDDVTAKAAMRALETARAAMALLHAARAATTAVGEATDDPAVIKAAHTVEDSAASCLLLAMQLKDSLVQAVRDNNRRMHQEFDLLGPYWGPGMTKAEAVARFEAAHPRGGKAKGESPG